MRPSQNHERITEHLGNDIQIGDHVLFRDTWDAIDFRGSGVFIAGGAIRRFNVSFRYSNCPHAFTT